MTKPRYTCSDYREEMILAGLQRRLASGKLDPEEARKVKTEIKKLEKAMGLD